MADDTTVTVMAEAVAAYDAASLPPEVVEQSKLLILDTLGCAIAAEGVELGRQVRRVAGDLGGSAQASLMGGAAKTSVLNAILVNGALVRVLDLNDYNIAEGRDGLPTMGGHPSDNIPVALAVGEWRRASGSEVIGAVALVYEVTSRIKAMVTRRGQFDGTSISGIAVPAMAGHLMGLTAAQLGHALAFGAARCMAPPLMRRGQISSGKSLANALIAQSGVQAAILAAEGATGPLEVLDHELGIRAMFVDEADLSVLTQPYDGAPAILSNHVKAYPCVGTGQAAVAAALELHGALKGRTAEIVGIDIVMAENAYVQGQQTDPGRSNPQSHAAADHCFPFTVAVALCDGEMTARQYENERWFDPEIVALMDRTKMSGDPGLTAKAPMAFPARIDVTLADGTVHKAEVLFPPGFSRGHLARGEVIDKFDRVTGPMIGAARRDTLKALVLRLDELDVVDELMAAMAAPIG